MLYIAVDQHAKQLTVSVRDEAGDVVLRRQVSTEWERVRRFWGRSGSGLRARGDSW